MVRSATYGSNSGTVQLCIGNIPGTAVPTTPTTILFISGITLIGFVQSIRNFLRNA
jgi:hypothetical protein